MEKKKMGRPTDDPKTIVKRARMSEDDVKKLNECCEINSIRCNQTGNTRTVRKDSKKLMKKYR